MIQRESEEQKELRLIKEHEYRLEHIRNEKIWELYWNELFKINNKLKEKYQIVAVDRSGTIRGFDRDVVLDIDLSEEGYDTWEGSVFSEEVEDEEDDYIDGTIIGKLNFSDKLAEKFGLTESMWVDSPYYLGGVS